ncbi:MAG: glycosyltransferase [Patescibacteria group bacterium]|mgnify:CR=1 FL=1
MKIAIVTPVFPPYLAGIGNVAAQEAAGLAQKGMEVTVFTPWYSDRDCPEMTSPYRVCRLWPDVSHGNAAWIKKMPAELSSFDIIHLHYPFIGAVGAVLRCKKSLVVTYHMDLVGRGWKGLFFKIYTRLTLSNLIKRADKILVSSMDYAEHSYLAPYLKKWSEKFVEAPFGVRDCFATCLPAGTALAMTHKDGYRKILFVGALDKAHYFKGVDILLEAMKGLKYKLVIVGDGDLRGYYEAKAKKLGLGDCVIFAGRVNNDELPRYYQSADVFVLPSIDKSEAYGLVLLEAMTHGLPVIASNLPGVRSLVGAERGLLIEPGNRDDLTRALREILSDDGKRHTMGITAKKWICENRTVEQEINKIIETYRDACQ